jgi:hypothetical protein
MYKLTLLVSIFAVGCEVMESSMKKMKGLFYVLRSAILLAKKNR